MTLRIHGGVILLGGNCPAGDAEDLLRALRDMPEAIVDIGGVVKLHMAVLQVLLALLPVVRGRPESGTLSQDMFRRLISDGDSGQESF